MNLISQTMKDTLKTLELLEEHIDRIAEQGIYEIERDLLLERLRSLYATVIATEAIAEEERVLDALAGIGVALPEPNEEPEIEIERIFADEEDEVPEIEPEVEETEDEEVIYPTEESLPCAMYGCPPAEFEEMEPEVIMEQPTEEPEEEPEVSEELDHEVVMSLYDDDDKEEEPQAEEPEVYEEESEEDIEEFIEEVEEPAEAEEEAPAEEPEEPQSAPQSVVLGDVLATEQPTLADNLAEQVVDVATASSANLSLRQSIAINDKFILLRDLFGGNNDYYETAIDRLDSFDNLDEAMLYIYDNFHWNPNSEGARLLMELLARKLF